MSTAAIPPIPTVPFGSRRIGPGEPVLIIAEIGINHEGEVALCERMIVEAAKAGVDSVKLQTMDADANYVVGSSSYSLFKKSALSREETARMFDLIRELGMEPFTTAGDADTIDWVDRLNPAAHKISSGLLTNLRAVRYAASKSRTVLMSTGMAERDSIDEAVAALRSAGAPPYALFQCTSQYPAPADSLNLRTIPWLEQEFGIPAGFSDHSVGCDAAVLSVGIGAKMLEKHFTLDSTREGYDHRLSLEPEGLADLVTRVRDAETMLGKSGKFVGDAERKKSLEMHRVVVAGRNVAAGGTLTEENLALKRPIPGSGGLQPRYYEKLFGRQVSRALAKDDPITPDVIEGGL